MTEDELTVLLVDLPPRIKAFTQKLASEYFAVTDMRLDTMHVLIRTGAVFGGVALIVAGMLALATAEKPRKGREYDAQRVYADELARRRKTEESWEAQQK